MHWELSMTGPVVVGPNEFSVLADRVLQVQRVVIEPPGLELGRVTLGNEAAVRSGSFLTPPLVVPAGTQMRAEVCTDKPLERVRVAFVGAAVPALTHDHPGDPHRLTVLECAKMLGATLGGLAMCADEPTLREALAWWVWHPSRLQLVYEANAEIEKHDALDDARAVAADVFGKFN